MTTATPTLTRAEAAYAHLASFAKGERVVIGGHALHSSEAVIKHAQTFPDNSTAITGAYLVAAVSGIGGEGGWAQISVADLLAGRHVEHDGEGQWNGNLTCFDPAGYAAQNHFHAVSDPASWSCEYAHPYATEADAAEYAAAVNAAGDCGSVTVVPCRKEA